MVFLQRQEPMLHQPHKSMFKNMKAAFAKASFREMT
jgi:hypothetical protein